MTNERCVEVIQTIKFILPDKYYNEETEEALDMAIKALEKEPCEDTISRQAVLEKAVYTETEEGWSGRTVDVKVIEALPPIKPKADVDALINKIETEMSWDMFDGWGNSTDLHDLLMGIIREWAESEE